MPTAKQTRTTKKQLQALDDAAECLRVLAHPHRLRIVQLLLSGQTYSVNELADACGIAQPMASDHLRLMNRCGFLQKEKVGRTTYYSVAEPHLAKLMDCLQSRFDI